MIQHWLHIFSELSTVQISLMGVFALMLIMRLVYLFMFTASVVFMNKSQNLNGGRNNISLIITLRNEEENIRKNLPQLLDLERDDFEVVVVDDYSQDNSLSVLGLFKQRYRHLKFSTLSQETRYSVKLAQNLALKSASNSWVLVTPVTVSGLNESWLESFLEKIETAQSNLVLGYSNLQEASGFYQILYRLENFFQQLKSYGFIRRGVPFVYNEENVAFKKEEYFAIGGFGKKMNETYANLELILNTFIRKRNTALNFSLESKLCKQEKATRESYVELLKKSYRIEKHLPYRKRMVLAVVNAVQIVFPFIVAATLVCCYSLWPLIIIALSVFVVAWMLIIKTTLNRLNERKIFIPSLVYGLLLPYLRLTLRWQFKRQYAKQKWKHRV